MKKSAPITRYIVNRMSHHAAHSGYDQLTHYIEGRVLGPNRLHRFFDRLPERVLANLRRSAGTWYNSQALKQELQNIPDFLFASGRIYHFLYGEDSFHYSGYLNPRASNKIVATFHMPPQKFLAITQGRRHLKTLDAVVVIAPNQEELFKNMVAPERVHLIPHGVDTRFFRSQEGVQRSGRRCIFVGVHMRNFQMLRQVMQSVTEKEGNITFTVITFEEYFHHFSGLRNVSLHASVAEEALLNAYNSASVAEEALLNAYNSADLLLMPVHDGTANNAILEAMACSLPVVATRVGGIPRYVNDGSAVLVEPDDVQGMADAVLTILNDSMRRQAMSREARTLAEQFDWTVIADRMRDLYNRLMEQ